MEVVVNEEKKKIFRARKTMKISDRQQLESLHNTLLTAVPGLSERSSPPLMNGTHKEDVPKAGQEDKEQNNVSGSNSPRAASPSSPASLSSPAPFLSLNLSPSPASSQSPKSKDDGPSSPTSPFHSLNFELKKMEEGEEGDDKKDSLPSTEESVKAPSTEVKENQEKGKDSIPEKKKKKEKEEHTTTDDPAVDCVKGSEKDTKQDKDIKSQDIKEEEDEIEDTKKESTEEEKMEVESVKVEPKKEKKDASQTTKPSRPSSTPPSSSAAQEEKGSTSGLKRTLSEGSETDGPTVKRDGKRPKVEREELEAQLELKITANAGSHHKLEKIVQRLVDERLRVLELTLFDHNLKELKDRVDKIDCATKHQTAINTLQAKIARLAKKFGEANQASENKRKSEALAAATANASKTVTAATSTQPQRPGRASMEIKQAQTVSSPSTAEEALAEMQPMSRGESDGGEISSVWNEEDQGSDCSFEPPEHKQNKKFVPVAPSVCESTPASSNVVQGRDGTIWTAPQPREELVRLKSQKVPINSMTPTVHAKGKIKDAVSAFFCLLDMKILEHIRDCTVAEAHNNGEGSSWDLSVAELKAFIALLYARGVYGKNMDFDHLWSQEWGMIFFRSTMPRDRFREIMRYLRFDKKQDQFARLRDDKFAPMSDVWAGFVKNSIACYQPGSNITIDEQLFPTNAKCRFTQYMTGKKKSIGMKFWVAADAETRYFLNGFPCLDKSNKPSHPHLGESVVMKLMEPFMGKGKTVTTKAFFTSLSLAKNLQRKNTSLVGEIDKSRPELPWSVQQNGELFSTKVLKHDRATLTVYQGTHTESVALLSTMQAPVCFRADVKKPKVVTFFEGTKDGVDGLDRLARLYSVENVTQKWPVAVFFSLLDIAGVNAYILMRACTTTSIPRKAFLLQLAKELREEFITTKASPQSVHYQQLREAPTNKKKKKCRINSHPRKKNKPAPLG